MRLQMMKNKKCRRPSAFCSTRIYSSAKPSVRTSFSLSNVAFIQFPVRSPLFKGGKNIGPLIQLKCWCAVDPVHFTSAFSSGAPACESKLKPKTASRGDAQLTENAVILSTQYKEGVLLTDGEDDIEASASAPDPSDS